MANFGSNARWGSTGRDEPLKWALVLRDGDLLVNCVLNWRVQAGDGRDGRKVRDMTLGTAEDGSAGIFAPWPNLVSLRFTR
jgi:hypothetical protein